MAAYNKFDIVVANLTDKVMDLFGSPIGDTLKVMLSNVAPVATNQVRTDITEIAAGFGYAAGGTAITTVNGTRVTGTMTLAGSMVVFTAAGGSIGPLRYVVLYDDTPAAPLRPLIAWWDYGSSITLLDGETLTVKFNSTDPGTIFTLT